MAKLAHLVTGAQLLAGMVGMLVFVAWVNTGPWVPVLVVLSVLLVADALMTLDNRRSLK